MASSYRPRLTEGHRTDRKCHEAFCSPWIERSGISCLRLRKLACKDAVESAADPHVKRFGFFHPYLRVWAPEDQLVFAHRQTQRLLLAGGEQGPLEASEFTNRSGGAARDDGCKAGQLRSLNYGTASDGDPCCLRVFFAASMSPAWMKPSLIPVLVLR